MVVNQKEYNMASLGSNYQKPPLFLPNQTRPSFLPLMKHANSLPPPFSACVPPPPHHFFIFLHTHSPIHPSLPKKLPHFRSSLFSSPQICKLNPICSSFFSGVMLRFSGGGGFVSGSRRRWEVGGIIFLLSFKLASFPSSLSSSFSFLPWFEIGRPPPAAAPACSTAADGGDVFLCHMKPCKHLLLH